MAKTEMFDVYKHALRFGKHDMERIGYFTEMPYMPARIKPTKKDLKKEAAKPQPIMLGGKSVLAGYPKTRCGNMDGYFDEEFKRVFSGERSRKKKGKAAKDTTIPFIPTGPSKLHATPGDFFGTFGPVLSEFSPVKRRRPKFVHEKPNAITNPGKKGGPGYIAITIGKYPEYKGGRPRVPKKGPKVKLDPLITVHFPKPYFYPNPYRDPKQEIATKRLYSPPKERKPDAKTMKLLFGRSPFIPNGPAKWDGGCKAGGFSKWPEWMKERWLNPLQREQALAGPVKKFLDGEFFPLSYAYKTKFTTSTLSKTDYCVNATNWKVYEPQWVKRLVKSVY